MSIRFILLYCSKCFRFTTIGAGLLVHRQQFQALQHGRLSKGAWHKNPDTKFRVIGLKNATRAELDELHDLGLVEPIFSPPQPRRK
jgi:hypothetical protein